MKNIFLFIVVALSLGCHQANDSKQITIVTTTGIVGDCIAQLVDKQAKVESIMGAGVDPHLYKPSQGDITLLSDADIVIYNGLHLEGKMAAMLHKLSQNKPVYAIGDYIAPALLKPADKTSELKDPHIWFDPTIWLQGLEGVARELDKQNKLDNIYHNYQVYADDINALFLTLKQDLDSNLSTSQRILITSHDAFSYFGDAFGFKVRGLQGISTTAEYGTKDVKDITDFIIDNHVQSVFVETSIPHKNLQAVVASAQARNYELNIGGTLYSDALGDENTPANTYKGMISTNVSTIIKGLK